MNRILMLTFLAAGMNASLLAQNAAQGYAYYSVDGYGDLAIGKARSVGAGGEGFLVRGLAVGGDAGYVTPAGDYGGATYWFHDRFGARFEVRDYHSRDGRFMSSFRFALSFR